MTTETVIKNRNGRGRKTLAITAAAALLLGGAATTSAIWNDSHTSDPVPITLANFGLEQTGYSVTINGQPIDPSIDKAAPGDIVQLDYDYRVTSDALTVVNLAADYVPNISYAGGGAMSDVWSWISTDVTGDTVVNQGLADAPYKVALSNGEATFRASATVTVPESLDTTWVGSTITYEGTMYVSQGDTVNADHGTHEVAAADVTVTPLGAAMWSGLTDGDGAHLSEQSDGTVQIVQTKPAPDFYVEFFTEGTIDSLIADGYFVAIG